MIQAYVLCRVCKYLYLCVTLRIWRQIWKSLFKGSKGISREREGGVMWGREDRGGEQRGKKKETFLGPSGFIRETGIKIPIVVLSQIPMRISWDNAKASFKNVQGSAQICDGGIYYNVQMILRIVLWFWANNFIVLGLIWFQLLDRDNNNHPN